MISAQEIEELTQEYQEELEKSAQESDTEEE